MPPKPKLSSPLQATIEFGPFPGTGQEPFFHSRASYPGFFGATGTGKTTIGAVKGIVTAFETCTPGVVAAPTYKMLSRSTLIAYKSVCPRALVAAPFHNTEQRMMVRCRDGSVVPIWFLSLDVPDFNWGTNVGWAHIDEVCLTNEYAFSVLDFRARVPMMDGRPNQVFVTGTPKGMGHWTWKFWGDPDRPNSASSPWWGMTVYDNPVLPIDTLHRWETRYGKTSLGDQELRGRWLAEGGTALIRWPWFRFYDRLPEFRVVVDSWDTALTANEWSNWTVGLTWGITPDFHYYLLGMVRARLEYPDVKRAIKRGISRGARLALIEDKASGQPALQELRLEGVPVTAFRPGTRDKHDRLQQASIPVEQGQVYLPSPAYARDHSMDWLEKFQEGVIEVPQSEEWDVADALSQFLLWAEDWRMSTQSRPPLSVITRYGDGSQRLIAPSRRRKAAARL